MAVKPECKRTRLMTIRVSPEEWKRITKASNEDDGVRSVSDWLRHAVMEKLERVGVGKEDRCEICGCLIDEFRAKVGMGAGRVAHYDCYYDKGS